MLGLVLVWMRDRLGGVTLVPIVLFFFFFFYTVSKLWLCASVTIPI